MVFPVTLHHVIVSSDDIFPTFTFLNMNIVLFVNDSE